MEGQVKIHHYLMEQNPSVAWGKRVPEDRVYDSVSATLSSEDVDLAGKKVVFVLPGLSDRERAELEIYSVLHDPRDQRQIVVIDGGVEPGCLPTNVELVMSQECRFRTGVDKVKVVNERLYDPFAPSLLRLDEDRTTASVLVRRLVLRAPPMAPFVFWRPRDRKSLWPGWVFAEWRNTPSGGLEIVWKTTER